MVLTPDQVIEEVCSHFGVTRSDLLSAGRRHKLVFARQVGMFLCRTHLGLSFPELGRIFGGRDHSTALYSCKKIEELQRDDKEVKSVVQALSERCRALDQKAT
jgi:chromosomal replication initiator protein